MFRINKLVGEFVTLRIGDKWGSIIFTRKQMGERKVKVPCGLLNWDQLSQREGSEIKWSRVLPNLTLFIHLKQHKGRKHVQLPTEFSKLDVSSIFYRFLVIKPSFLSPLMGKWMDWVKTVKVKMLAYSQGTVYTFPSSWRVYWTCNSLLHYLL